MATIGYKAALGGMAKDAIKGAGNALVGGLKGAILSEMPAVTAGMAFGKELRNRANAPKMQSGGAPSTNQQASTSSAMGGFGASVSLAAGQNKLIAINIEQVRQLKQLNDAVANQSRLIAFQILGQKRKDQFAEEISNEQAFRDDELLKAIKQIGSRDSSGKKSSDDSRGGSFLGKLGDLISDNIGTIASLYLGGKGLGAAGRVLGGIGRGGVGRISGSAVPRIGMAGRAGAGAFIDVQSRVISSTVARGALAEGVATIVPMVLRFLTGPIGLSIMAAAGMGAYLYSKRDPEKAAAAGADSALKRLNNAQPGSSGQYKDMPLDQKQAKNLMEDRAKKEEVAKKAEAKAAELADPAKSPKATPQEIETAKKLAQVGREAVDYDIKSFGGLNRVQTIAEGKKDPGSPVTMDKYLKDLARTESATKAMPGGDPNATNPKSTAGGLYQFLGDPKDTAGNPIKNPDGTIKVGTWKTTVNSMIAAGVLSKEDAETNYLDDRFRFDPAKATKVAAYFTEKNRVGLKSALGRDPTETDLYMAHFMGLGNDKSGAIKFLKLMDQDPNALGEDVAGKGPAAANAAIFYEDGKPRTISQIYAMLGQRLTGNKSGIPAKIVEPSTSKEKAPASRKFNEPPKPFTPNNKEADNYYKGLGVSGTGKGGTSNIGIVPIVAKGNEGGDGTQIKDNKPIPVHDKKVFEQNENIAKVQGVNPKNGSPIKSVVNAGTALQTKAFKPLFKNNSDIIADANKTFLQQFRSTATSAFTQAITKGLFPKGVGVSAGQAGRDDNFRGQQLQKIFGTDKVINDATTKLLGKQYGPMFAPLFNNLAQGYLEVGSRVAGKAIFQGIGGLGAQETQTITGQVLGNFAAGNKKLALEQLLYGASGGSKGGIALGPETLLAKYGFANPAEGVSYFANALGERATQPFAKMMGADDRNKSVIFDPRTKQYVYADTGERASQADINASGNYGAPVSQSTVFSSGMNNYGMPGAPYQTTAGVSGTYRVNGGAQYQQILNAKEGQGLSRSQYFGLTEEAQAKGGLELKARQDLQIAADMELANRQIDVQKSLAEAGAKRDYAIATQAAKTDQELGIAKNAFDKAMTAAQISSGTADTGAVIAKLDEIKTGSTGSGSVIKDANGNPIVRQSGQLFSQSVGPDGKIINDPMKEIGNFGFDMLKNAAGNALTQNIKNPYMQMVANFAIQKGLNYGVDALFGKGGFDVSSVMDFFKGPAGNMGGGFGDLLALDSVPTPDLGWFDIFNLADGGPITGPGTGRSDSIPAMLSNGEFVVNAGATKKYRPLLDALNYADGTPSTPGSVNALSKALGTDKQINALGDQTTLLTSIDNSLISLSGGGTGSGTSFSTYGGASFDIGLGGNSSGGGGGRSNTMNGVARSRRTQQKPSTMDYVEAIGTSVLKSMAINKGIGMASTAVFGATPMAMAGNFISGVSTGFTHGAGAFAGDTIVAVGTESGLAVGSSIAEFFGVSSAATGSSAAAAAATAGEVAAAGAGAGGLGAGLMAAAPYLLAAVAVFMVVDSIYGDGGDSPPPKEPKFHAAIYVAGNNNVSAITTILETREYHAVPDVFKTVAYGLLKVAFNATKTSEQVTKTPAPYDWVYMKVQYDRVSMLWGKGAPNPATLADDGASEVKRWPALDESTNLNSYASDILGLVRDEFKKNAKTENLSKLDQAASALGSYSLGALSSGLVSDLKSGNYALDTSIEKGIYADNVAESNRISELVRTAAAKAAYVSVAGEAEYTQSGGGENDSSPLVTTMTKAATVGGVPMVWSVKDGAFVENKYPGALVLDANGRPVFDIEGTSSGLSVEDFVSASVAGTSRSANILQPPPTITGSGSAGSTNNTVVGGAKIDNSTVTTFVNSLTTVTDVVRSTTNQVGLIGG